eukprot:1958948-Amphidinium_carterae.1
MPAQCSFDFSNSAVSILLKSFDKRISILVCTPGMGDSAVVGRRLMDIASWLLWLSGPWLGHFAPSADTAHVRCSCHWGRKGAQVVNLADNLWNGNYGLCSMLAIMLHERKHLSFFLSQRVAHSKSRVAGAAFVLVSLAQCIHMCCACEKGTS